MAEKMEGLFDNVAVPVVSGVEDGDTLGERRVCFKRD